MQCNSDQIVVDTAIKGLHIYIASIGVNLQQNYKLLTMFKLLRIPLYMFHEIYA